MKKVMDKKVFVTVGTTEFDELVRTVCNHSVLLILKNLGYTNVLLQIGKGNYVPDVNVDGMLIDHYRYKKSIIEDIKNSDLIISHAGAGTCLEVLQNGKLLLAVINEKLMDNHQFELAEEFYKNNFLFYCTCMTLKETIENINIKSIKPYPRGNLNDFINCLNKTMGFDNK